MLLFSYGKNNMKISEDKVKIFNKILLPKLCELHNAVIQKNIISEFELYEIERKFVNSKSGWDSRTKCNALIGLTILAISFFVGIQWFNHMHAFLLGVRCIVPNNYIIWEATRPITNCDYCRDITKPTILRNVSRQEFAPHAYSTTPTIVKGAAKSWPATELLTYDFIKKLYELHPDEVTRFRDECQFLHFKSNIMTLRELFEMSEERAKSGRDPWYVGFSNCQPDILNELRKLYPIPHFLPSDAEIPNTDYIFLGYDRGAVMHLDYIPRLMWQAQLRGNKSWNLAPTPECESDCTKFSFFVEPGDIVLIDTRVWYHSTTISKNEFSLTIQSEYG